VFEVDIPARTLVQTGEYDGIELYGLRAFSPDGNRMIVRKGEGAGRESLVLDARTARPLFRFPSPQGVEGRVVAFLADGKLLLADRKVPNAKLTLLGPDGNVERTFALGRSDLVAFGGQTDESKILATFGEPSDLGNFGDFVAVEINLDNGEQRLLADNRAVVANWRLPVANVVGSPAVELLLSDGALVRRDPQTGHETVVAGRLK
jgi:hypothetical protein